MITLKMINKIKNDSFSEKYFFTQRYYARKYYFIIFLNANKLYWEKTQRDNDLEKEFKAMEV